MGWRGLVGGAIALNPQQHGVPMFPRPLLALVLSCGLAANVPAAELLTEGFAGVRLGFRFSAMFL